MVNVVGFPLIAFGAFVTAFNLYVGYGRYSVHRLQGRSRDSFQYVSGLPLAGSTCLWIGAGFLLWGGRDGWAWLAAGASLFDTGGIHWFLTSLWLNRDRTGSSSHD